ncbi:hypothetical protein EVAR_96100_1 [Eumeta japonica]|uniref:Uncharacterized protein n=1 Tax=Eumeta variegata TaxID=151549 RepID=A0A4C1VFU2_EUMVA|nr:hypothetical protein EVAR_96100_1 [Eumeta japonica]
MIKCCKLSRYLLASTSSSVYNKRQTPEHIQCDRAPFVKTQRIGIVAAGLLRRTTRVLAERLQYRRQADWAAVTRYPYYTHSVGSSQAKADSCQSSLACSPTVLSLLVRSSIIVMIGGVGWERASSARRVPSSRALLRRTRASSLEPFRSWRSLANRRLRCLIHARLSKRETAFVSYRPSTPRRVSRTLVQDACPVCSSVSSFVRRIRPQQGINSYIISPCEGKSVSMITQYFWGGSLDGAPAHPASCTFWALRSLAQVASDTRHILLLNMLTGRILIRLPGIKLFGEINALQFDSSVVFSCQVSFHSFRLTTVNRRGPEKIRAFLISDAQTKWSLGELGKRRLNVSSRYNFVYFRFTLSIISSKVSKGSNNKSTRRRAGGRPLTGFTRGNFPSRRSCNNSQVEGRNPITGLFHLQHVGARPPCRGAFVTMHLVAG